MFIQISARQSNACAGRAGGRMEVLVFVLFFFNTGTVEENRGANLQEDGDDLLWRVSAIIEQIYVSGEEVILSGRG